MSSFIASRKFIWIAAICAVFSHDFKFSVSAAESTSTPPPTTAPPASNQQGTEQAKSKVSPDYNPEDRVRNFYQVLEDVLGDFEYDLKNGQVSGLKDTSIRNIATSENVPTSFKNHLELLVTERVLQNTKSRFIQCLQCRSKKATLTGNNMVISSPENDPALLARIAKTQGIVHFMDIAFSYQPSGMIISFYVTESENGSVVWSRSYNSETSRAAAFRRGVDYSQLDQGRNTIEYEPTIQYHPVLYYMFEPDISTSMRGSLGLGIRIVERYDNRKREVGFELNYMLPTSSLTGSASSTTSTTTASVYSGLNLTLLFMHAWNLIGDVENFHKPRGSIFAGIGGTYASGFLGALVRSGYEWRLGKHWAISGSLGYRPTATLFVGGTSAGSVSGLEFGIGVGALF